MDYRLQRGFFGLHFLLGLGVAVVLAGSLGYAYLSLAAASAASQRRTMSLHSLQQAVFTLSTEAKDIDNDGFPDSTPGSGGTNFDGWNIPPSSGAPKVDGWNSAFRYCPWHNGVPDAGDKANSGLSTSGRLTGANPAAQNSLVFAVISGGPDKVIQTSCAQARTGKIAVATDDAMLAVSEGQVMRGVGGTVYFGDPQLDEVSLVGLPNPSVKKGQIRIVGDTAYVNVTGQGGTVASGNWEEITGTNTPSSFVFPVVETPVLRLNGTTTSLSPFWSVLDLTEGGVQYQVYSDSGLTQLVKDSGVLPAGSSFDFQSFVGSGTKYYIGRRKAIRRNLDGLEVWSKWSAPVSVQNGYNSGTFATPSTGGDRGCPIGWVWVPPMRIPTNSAGGTIDVASFCVMPYPAVMSASGQVRTTASPKDAWFRTLPWVNISWQTASATCKLSTTQDAAGNAVSGAQLMTESQWLAIAHNVAAVAENWSDGKVGVQDGGNSVLLPGLTASAGVTSPQPASFIPSDVNQRRDKRLSTGAVIYDIGGNVSQLTYLDTSLGGNAGLLTSSSVPSAIAAVPFASGTRGMGVYSDAVTAGNAPARGGSFVADDLTAGAFRMASIRPDVAQSNVGFRCTK